MAVLITGGAGYIGSHAVLAALDAGRRVVVLDDLTTGERTNVPLGATFVEGSIRDLDLVERVIHTHGVVEVLHFAAQTQAAASLANPLGYYQANAAWTCGLIAACIRCGVEAFVLSSTAAVYGEAPPRPLREDDPVTPVTPYGASKAMAERMLRDAARASGLRYAILRYFNVAGLDPLGRARLPLTARDALIPAACRAAVEGSPFALYGRDFATADGSAVRDLVHVSDVAAAHLLALDAIAKRTALTLNLGSGRGWSVLDVVEAVGRLSGQPLSLLPRARRPGDLGYAVADPALAASEIGWRAHFDLDDMIGHTLQGLSRASLLPGPPVHSGVGSRPGAG